MNREIKFRTWDGAMMRGLDEIVLCARPMIGITQMKNAPDVSMQGDGIAFMQFIGLKDKNGLQDVYEGDILDSNGKIKGNIYETNAKETDLVIRGFGTDAWIATYQEAMDRGCKNA